MRAVHTSMSGVGERHRACPVRNGMALCFPDKNRSEEESGTLETNLSPTSVACVSAVLLGLVARCRAAKTNREAARRIVPILLSHTFASCFCDSATGYQTPAKPSYTGYKLSQNILIFTTLLSLCFSFMAGGGLYDISVQ